MFTYKVLKQSFFRYKILEFTFYCYTIFFLKKDNTTPATTLWMSP
jgi:hypothetical protein